MDYWNLVWLVIMLGLTVVGPVIALVVSVHGLGAETLSEKQRREGEKELRKAGIVREGEEWEVRDLDELMLNMRRYDQWQRIGVAVTILLTGGVGTIALAVLAHGSIITSKYGLPASGLFLGATTLGVSVGYIMSDRHFMAREGTLPAPSADAIFSGADGVFRSPWWLRVIDGGLIAGVIVCTLVYAIGKGGTLDDTTVASVVARHPWLIWSTPVALCVIMLAQELLVRWEMQRPPLRLAGQPELAERADLHRRREAYKALFSDWTVFFSIPWLSMSYLMTFDGLVDSSIQFPLSLAAFLAWMLGIFVYGMADTRRKRLARRAGDAGLRGGGGVI